MSDMKRGIIAAGAVAMLLLTGCTATNQAASNDTGSSAAPVASEAPLVAETPTAAADGGETAFLTEVRAKLRPDNVIPNATDEQLLAAGHLACERLAESQSGEQVSVIDGEKPDQGGYYRDSIQILNAAASTLC
ncbi:MAG: hypothetical protein BGO45_10580 [Microbacterium sp. 71-36]|nr:DUF732 domain-containing protein [Microbacterium sp.]OJV77237.1 MAG: hypothetical protein BGO45_10580 [Microbacterium sp. 71-36]